MPSPFTPSIGLILCSSRQPRVCPQIAAFITRTISSLPTTPSAPLHEIDLLTWNLPIFNEPALPSQVTTHTSYSHAHTQAWSLEIQKHSGFIFVLPQYNWGYPAVIKNAIDYLYHEWRGKPAMIVSYGGHGGVKAAGQLRQVLMGVGMDVGEGGMVALAFPSREVLGRATRGEELVGVGVGVGEGGGIWDAEREEVRRGFEELVGRVSGSGSLKGLEMA
ncbi:hypothetical protein MMC28_006394 [Mycoblastus sanguinarius]|nr:hypothetical protein [Mycoblastus sanguinarius]